VAAAAQATVSFRVIESSIEAACVKHAAKRGCISVKLQGGAVGTPDRLFLLPDGKTMAVEFKTPTGRLSARQKLVFDQWAEIRHPVLIIRQTKTFRLLLDALLGVL
jgi:hypothetical protein